MPRYRLLLLLFGVLSLSARADEPLSLEAVVERALEIAPQVGAGTANVEGMQASAISAGRLPDP